MYLLRLDSIWHKTGRMRRPVRIKLANSALLTQFADYCTIWVALKIVWDRYLGGMAYKTNNLFGSRAQITISLSVFLSLPLSLSIYIYAGHCWRSRDELIRDVLLWTPTHGHARAGRPARTYIQQLCEDTGCCPEGRWTIGRSGERGSGISVLPARYDDDDDDIVVK